MARENLIMERDGGKAGATSVSERVILAVADEHGVDPVELDPMYWSLDPDALDALFRDRKTETLQVRFRLWGCEVVVDGDGTVTAELAD